MTTLDTPLRLLQLVGLTLPAIALYMSVLTEIHMVTERKRDYVVADPNPPDGAELGDLMEPDNFNVRFTDAIRKPDFFFATFALLALLFAGILLLFAIVLGVDLLLRIGIAFIAVSYALLGAGVVATMNVVVREIIAEDES